MPRGIPNVKPVTVPVPQAPPSGPLEATLEEVALLLESRRAEFQSAADQCSEILASLAPKPRVGRPPKTR